MFKKLITDSKRSPKRSLFTCPILLIPILLASSCDDNETSSSCEESVKVLPSPESVSALLGESGADLLAAIDPKVTDSAIYSDNETILTQTPLGGTSVITISTVYDAGEIREIESVEHDGGTMENIICKSRLEMDVTIGVETADGALMESWSAVLYREEGSDPVLKAEIDPNAAFAGSFDIVSYNDPSSPEEVTGEFINRFREEAADNSGYIQFGLTHREGDIVGHVTHDALSW